MHELLVLIRRDGIMGLFGVVYGVVKWALFTPVAEKGTTSSDSAHDKVPKVCRSLECLVRIAASFCRPFRADERFAVHQCREAVFLALGYGPSSTNPSTSLALQSWHGCRPETCSSRG